ncbi:MAG: universal stress protein [Capsulimonadaceae bacterium]|nr:universal stress protein [Capsulimonadaceae bacterium]
MELLAPDEVRSATGNNPLCKGRLKLFLSFAAGVGKTYSMLAEAKRRKANNGEDVVIGYIESHGRQATEDQIGDLEVIPRRNVEYRGAYFDELDVERIIRRNPSCVVIDELAHLNVPGMNHAKRYEDVLEILSHGISVLTAMNVQHLESLNDVVLQITGVKIRETVPDSFLRNVDEIVTVDISPEALINRLQRGAIYPTTRVPLALANFFTEGNLSALRQLLLREVATEVDRSVQTYRQRKGIDTMWRTQERVMVCMSPDHPCDRLLRRGWRVASRLQADIVAVYVAPATDVPQQKRILDVDCRLAAELNIVVERLEGKEVATTLADFAWKHQITEIVIGHSRESKLAELVKGSIINDLIRRVRGIDVLIIANSDEPKGK